MMYNHWLNLAKAKQLFKEIDEIISDVWGNDGTLADIFAVLNDEQTEFFMNMAIKEFVSDPDELSMGIELVEP